MSDSTHPQSPAPKSVHRFIALPSDDRDDGGDLGVVLVQAHEGDLIRVSDLPAITNQVRAEERERLRAFCEKLITSADEARRETDSTEEWHEHTGWIDALNEVLRTFAASSDTEEEAGPR